MTTEKLALVTTTLNGITTRSVEHPEHGPLIMCVRAEMSRLDMVRDPEAVSARVI